MKVICRVFRCTVPLQGLGQAAPPANPHTEKNLESSKDAKETLRETLESFESLAFELVTQSKNGFSL